MRDEGYYWVKFHDDVEWEVAEWWNGRWQRCGSDVYYHDADVEQVGLPRLGAYAPVGSVGCPA